MICVDTSHASSAWVIVLGVLQIRDRPLDLLNSMADHLYFKATSYFNTNLYYLNALRKDRYL